MLVDTIAATVKIAIDHSFDERQFSGEVISSDARSGEVQHRMFLNHPVQGIRLTWYPPTRVLRAEWSVGRRESVDTRVDALLLTVDDFLKGVVGDVPPITTWTCQRVDYAVNLEVSSVAAYMMAIQGLSLASMTRHPFDDTGVVWKSRGKRGRWVKFYDTQARRTHVQGTAAHGTLTTSATASGPDATPQSPQNKLRYEVSNYRDAVRYMAARWFSCERTVEAMTQPGRALYVLARMWSQLGLHRAGFGAVQAQQQAMLTAFGTRGLASAQHAQQCISQHGTAAYNSLGLMSKSSYYRWLSRLKQVGLLTASTEGLQPLVLPCEPVFEAIQASQNLEHRSQPPIEHDEEKTGPKNTEWSRLAAFLGINSRTEPISWLLRAYDDWNRWQDLDRTPRGLPEASAIADVPAAVAGAAVGVGAV